MKTIEGLGDVSGKRVLVRSDLNVPLDGTRIIDDGRIRASVPTIAPWAVVTAATVDVRTAWRPASSRSTIDVCRSTPVNARSLTAVMCRGVPSTIDAKETV